MALSPVELIEEDCQTLGFIETVVFSRKHAQSLVGKYYKIAGENFDDWQVLDEDTAISLINRKIMLRSPMTCHSPNFRVCKKCFGTREFPTKYVGIVAGQVVSERLTQLIMRSFHTSGSANLDISNEVKEFIKDHLVDIQQDENGCYLYFDNNEIPSQFKQMESFNYHSNNFIAFEPITRQIRNKDAVSIMLKVKSLLKTIDYPERSPTDFYEELMSYLLEVGVPYSSFVEILFANMFLCDKEGESFWRYNQNDTVVRKVNDKRLAMCLSPSLGCLYQPNKTSLNQISNIDQMSEDDALTIYERIWSSI